MTARKRRRNGLIVLLLTGLVLTALHGWQTHSAPYDCADASGHGPDRGTNECEMAIQYAIASRPAHVANAFQLGLALTGSFGLFYCLIWLLADLAERRSQRKGPPDRCDGPFA